MSRTHEFRALTGTPAPLLSGQYCYYVNQSGALRFINTGGFDQPAAGAYSATGVKATGGVSNISTGNAVFTAGINAVIYGNSGNALAAGPTILGEPTAWVNITGPNGELWAYPAYTRTT